MKRPGGNSTKEITTDDTSNSGFDAGWTTSRKKAIVFVCMLIFLYVVIVGAVLKIFAIK